MATARTAGQLDQTPAHVGEPATPARHLNDSDAKSDDGWSTEESDGSFTSVHVPAGWIPGEQEPSA